LSMLPFNNGLIVGGIIGLFVGLLYHKSTETRTTEVITWSWTKVFWAFVISTPSGSIGFLIAISLALYGTISYEVFPLIYLLISVLVGGILSTLATRIFHRNTHQHTLVASNQRIWHAFWRGTVVGMITAVLALVMKRSSSILFDNHQEI